MEEYVLNYDRIEELLDWKTTNPVDIELSVDDKKLHNEIYEHLLLPHEISNVICKYIHSVILIQCKKYYGANDSMSIECRHKTYYFNIELEYVQHKVSYDVYFKLQKKIFAHGNTTFTSTFHGLILNTFIEHVHQVKDYIPQFENVQIKKIMFDDTIVLASYPHTKITKIIDYDLLYAFAPIVKVFINNIVQYFDKHNVDEYFSIED